MNVLRTPDERFEHLPDFPFAPHYVDIPHDDGALRMHYIDEGPRDGEVVLMLHGEPSWSYLYRFMIPLFAAAGYRAIAPDLIGFGRSDKLPRQSDYTYEKHVAWMRSFIEKHELNKINLVCQDWGSLIGLRLAAENEDRFSRIALGNGGLPDGSQAMPKAFKVWKSFARLSPVFPIGKIVAGGCVNRPSKEIIAAYDAPFPSPKFKAATRVFPRLVPVSPDDPAAPANKSALGVFANWQKPFLTAFSNRDPITRGGERMWQKLVPGARDVQHVIIKNAGHFLQEDKGPEFAQAVIDFMRAH